MLQEIPPEKQCPICEADLIITGTIRKHYLIHTCFECKRSFVYETTTMWSTK